MSPGSSGTGGGDGAGWELLLPGLLRGINKENNPRRRQQQARGHHCNIGQLLRAINILLACRVPFGLVVIALHSSSRW